MRAFSEYWGAVAVRHRQLNFCTLDGRYHRQMVGADVLLTVAEVGVALAGFSSIVAVFGQRAGSPSSRCVWCTVLPPPLPGHIFSGIVPLPNKAA